MTIYKAYWNNRADHITVEVADTEEIIHIYPRQILPLAVQLGVIDTYTRDFEAVYSVPRSGYFDYQTGEWVELDNEIKVVEFHQWLALADYDDLEKIATEFLNQKNKQNGNSSE